MLNKFLYIIFISSFLYSNNLLLLKKYNENKNNINNWLMSEKLDGVRAYWNGKELISKSDKKFNTPKWFIKDFPPFHIDGELWIKRNNFEKVISIVNKKNPTQEWSNLTYNIFDVPNDKIGLLKRLDILKDYLKNKPNKYIKIIKQIRCKDKKELNEFLNKIVKNGGEGVVIRKPNQKYFYKRSKNDLKVKKYFDDECKIIGFTDGKGKYKGFVGSIICKLENDKIIKIGSGLTDKLRKNPPKIGQNITFKFYGYTKNKIPKFPVFLRVRK